MRSEGEPLAPKVEQEGFAGRISFLAEHIESSYIKQK
jgi:hypothetical protein